MSTTVERVESTPDVQGGEDWEIVGRSAAFQELVARRRRFVLPVTVFAMSWWSGFVLLACYSHDFMAESVYKEVTVAYVLGLSQFLLVFAIVWGYLRVADTDFEPRERRLLDEVEGRRS
ncbi:MAG TPA: DUF485 domain-containing protein [Thermoleophilaceae bacterium]|jgi:uncharacterized membrane protein (DUF485 family)